jgi:hypothetical protein
MGIFFWVQALDITAIYLWMGERVTTVCGKKRERQEWEGGDMRGRDGRRNGMQQQRGGVGDRHRERNQLLGRGDE